MTYPKFIEYSLRFPATLPTAEDRAAAKKIRMDGLETRAEWNMVCGYSGAHKVGSFESYCERQEKAFDDEWDRTYPDNLMTNAVRRMIVTSPENEAMLRRAIEQASYFQGWLA